MARKVFKSKTDAWIRLVLVVAIVVELVVAISVGLALGDPLQTTIILLVCFLAAGLFVSILIGTHYTVDRGMLRVVSGPFRWKVRLDDIQAVEATRSPLSSPALSLDRIRIRYGRNRRIMVSPEDRRGFLRAIGKELDH